ncbi:allergenic cerato-platanin Asp F13 [Aspergillus clavatus NRRL 1]|uniref:Allergen Asp F13 n=1 Tax=Aspergillus clavatus (strain ATCC 1007 / CBS 513.65 / DSM 816 / NCTC 3887 / NRRL 1 / QM 1276 / 107) TaxID=344612 RepID=A1C6U7_ASPCL|nr:allergen Asp F13 [Aspergillus clavatus NRRL 1]EAW14118.1 allergen Asp F13 [Aspergillus clavatus NRRL 1]
MKSFTSTLSLLALFLSSSLAVPTPDTNAAAATSVSVSYDQRYDVAGNSMSTTSCSDGLYGLASKWPTFGAVPSFALIGGAPTIPGWNSPNCGKCYKLHFAAGNVDQTIYVTAIDAAPGGFNIGLNAMNQLTGGLAGQLGRVTATYEEADKSFCKQ